MNIKSYFNAGYTIIFTGKVRIIKMILLLIISDIIRDTLLDFFSLRLNFILRLCFLILIVYLITFLTGFTKLHFSKNVDKKL